MKYLLIIFVILCPSFAAEKMPNFGDSVEFSKGDSPFEISDVKGKAVYLLFFQSWCGICNGWAPGAIKALQDKHSGKKGLIFVALKTDGGSPEAAKKFLVSKGADESRWLIGTDAGASLYKKIFGKADLWDHMIIGPNGEIVKKNTLGMYFSKGGKKQFVAGTDRLLEGCPSFNSALDLPASKDLKKAAILAEVGNYKEAYKICAKSKSDKGEKESLLRYIDDLLAEKVKTSAEFLDDADSTPWQKYEAIVSLESLKSFRVPGLREALLKSNKAKIDKLVSAEFRAAKEYDKIISKYKPSSKRSTENATRYLKNLASRFPNTYYGKLAESGLPK